MDLKNLNTFIHVAEQGSFSRAGELLGYSQPTVSVQIKQLEEELGFRLFDRIGHTVRLTDRGRDMLLHAQHICHIQQKMLQQSGQERQLRGTIRLATADSLCSSLVLNEFPEFRAIYPEISLKLTTAGTTQLFRLLDCNEVDLVCTLDSHIYNANYIIAGEEQIGVHFVVSTKHPLAKAKQIVKEDLLKQNFLLTEKGMSYRRLLDEWMACDSMEIQPILETGRADLICNLIEQGLGMSFLPDYVTDGAVARGTIVRLDVQEFRPELWKQFLYHRDKWVSEPMQALIHHFTRKTPE